jgi:hypothetical protein
MARLAFLANNQWLNVDRDLRATATDFSRDIRTKLFRSFSIAGLPGIGALIHYTVNRTPGLTEDEIEWAAKSW